MTEIRFDDGAVYEDFMGTWSRITGDRFLQWLAPAPGGRWVDVGCGNGASTELLVQRCAPSEVQGIDPSPAQLDFARRRFAPGVAATFRQGDAMALPYDSGAFDAAVMALVIFFVPEPARGVAEMARVVRPGGSVSAYAWDIQGGGFPFAPMQDALVAMGSHATWPPRIDAATVDALQALWQGAGLVDVETCRIRSERRFADFDAFWNTAQGGPGVAPRIAAMAAADVARLKDTLRQRLDTDADGGITCSAVANAVKGRVPA